MRMMAYVVICFAAIAAKGAEASAWKTFHNPRFGTTADVPSDWHIQPPPENGDGRTFLSPDGKAKISIYGSFNGTDGSDEGTISYHKQGHNFVVYSGTRNGLIFYHKEVATCRARIRNNVFIEYPATDKGKYDSMVTHVSNSLRGGSGLETSDCK